MPIHAENFFYTSDGARIFFTDQGKGETIVFLHGYKCSSQFFDSTASLFAQNYRVITMDFRGHGYSSKVCSGHNLETYARDLEELLSSLGIRRFFLAAWSMGGSVALKYLSLYQKDVRGLALVDCTLSPYSGYSWNMHGMRLYNLEATAKVVSLCCDHHEAYCAGFAEKIWNLKGSPEQKEWVKQELLKTPPHISMAIYTEFLHTDGVKMLEDVRIPTLFFGSDSLVSPNGNACAQEHYPSFLPKGTKRESCGGFSTHVPFLSEAPRFCKALENFIHSS